MPTDVPHIKGLAFLMPGGGQNFMLAPPGLTASNEFAYMARSMDYALVDARFGFDFGGTPAETRAALDATTSEIINHLGGAHAEVANAPAMFFGFSAGAIESHDIALRIPDRVVSFTSLRGAFIQEGSPDPGAVATIPGIFIPGALDTTALVTRPRSVNDTWRQWRETPAGASPPDGGQAAVAVDWNAAHGHRNKNQSWDMAWIFAGETNRLRYPEDAAPSAVPGTPFQLNNIDTTNGWLGDITEFTENPTLGGADLPVAGTVSPFLDIKPFASVTSAERLGRSWLPSEAAANAYRAFTSSDASTGTLSTDVPLQGPLKFLSPSRVSIDHPEDPAFELAVHENGQPIYVEVDPRSFDDDPTKPLVQFDLFDGDALVASVANPGAGNLTATFVPDRPGVHALVAVATRDNGGVLEQTSGLVTIAVQAKRADLNSDGVVDDQDVGPFVTAINAAGDINVFLQAHAGASFTAADVNRDGVVDAADIQPFSDALSASPLGDVDQDTVVDAADIDLLYQQLGEADLFFDLNNDGQVSQSDVDFLVQDILHTAYGDTNLDLRVDLDDFNTLAANFGSVGSWADGEFDGADPVDLNDFNWLAANFGFDATGASANGDLNNDGVVDAGDIDLLYLNLGSSDLTFDLNNDALVTANDVATLVEQVLGTFFGDGNLDLKVDLTDFNLLAANFGAAGGWAQGDYDGNGLVELDDFNLLLTNFGSDASGSPVPEPTLLVLWIGLLGSTRPFQRSGVGWKRPGRQSIRTRRIVESQLPTSGVKSAPPIDTSSLAS